MISDREFEAILMDESKRVEVDIEWRADRGRVASYYFRVPLASGPGYPIEVFGRWNQSGRRLSYVLLYSGVGRIYGLDVGHGHRNPDGELLGSPHKHKWSADFRDRQAYMPSDITAQWHEPVRAWGQFCAEARIVHLGRLGEPSRIGEERL